MRCTIPSAKAVQRKLKPLSRAEMEALSDVSKVPFQTLWKVRTGETGNPGIETVRKFFDRIPARRPPRPKTVRTDTYEGPDRREGGAQK